MANSVNLTPNIRLSWGFVATTFPLLIAMVGMFFGTVKWVQAQDHLLSQELNMAKDKFQNYYETGLQSRLEIKEMVRILSATTQEHTNFIEGRMVELTASNKELQAKIDTLVIQVTKLESEIKRNGRGSDSATAMRSTAIP